MGWQSSRVLQENKEIKKIIFMTLNILISCMHQDKNIIERSNVQSDVVVINQCNENKREEFTFTNKNGRECKALFISTTERGLSRSRNMALRNAWGDICLICDDDETLYDDCEGKILGAYETHPQADVITFALNRADSGKQYPKKEGVLGFRQILRTSSQQISFKRKLLFKQGEKNPCVVFDELMGSGTGNGGGEENKFLLDCKKLGLKLRYIPNIIATVNPGESQWFNGYDEKQLINVGWTSRRMLGILLGSVYAIYFWIRHRYKYKEKGVSMAQAFGFLTKGFFEVRQ